MVFGGSWIAKPSATATPPVFAEPLHHTFIHQGLQKDSKCAPADRPDVAVAAAVAKQYRPGASLRGRATAPSQQSPELNPNLRSSSQDDQRFVQVHMVERKRRGAKTGRKLSASHGSEAEASKS
jgi:hypothetical protein